MLGWFKSKKKKKETETSLEPVSVDGGSVTDIDEATDEVSSAELDGSTPDQPQVVSVNDLIAEEVQPAETEAETDESVESGVESPSDDIEQGAGNEQETSSADTKELSLFGRLQKKLSKTRKSFVYRLDTLFLGRKEIDQELFDDLEEILITADMGVMTSQVLLDEVRKEVKRNDLKDPQLLKNVLGEKIREYLVESDTASELALPEDGPLVIMVVGVNGVGKTTSIGKIAAKFSRSGKSVLLVAADTFRAAAVEQLKIWAKRCGVDIVAQDQGADPSSVVFDGLEYGRARDVDVIIVDTAGRLHTQVNLMEELKKIKRVMSKKMDGAPHEVMLVLDATTGQNGISQAKLFNEAVGITGITLTKLDGTARGGIVVNISRELGIPVRFIGIGEQIDDLRDFDPGEFVDALFFSNDTTQQAAE